MKCKATAVLILVVSLIAAGNLFSGWQDGAKVTVSTVDSDDVAGENVIDGDMNTRWSSKWDDNQWLIIELSEPMEVYNMIIYWETAFTKHYKISVSNDNESYRKVYEQTSGQGGKEKVQFSPIKTKYIKFDLITKATQWGHSIYEIKLNQGPKISRKKSKIILGAEGNYKVSASSSEPDMDPEAVVDGDMNTRWSSKFNDNEWLQVEFNKPRNLHTIVLNWEDAYAKEYSVLVSKYGQDWKTVKTENNSDGGKDVIDFEEISGVKYVRLDLQKRATEWGNSLYEITFNQAPVKEVTASSGDGAYSPENALDRDWNTRWSSNFSDDEWWQVEFEKPRSICGITLHWETAFGEKYKIEVETADGNWVEVNKTMEGDGHRDIIYFNPLDIKKLKIQGIQRGTGWGYSIYEIDFHNGDNPPKLSASSTETDNPPELGLDGNKSSAWHSKDEKQSEFNVVLPKTWKLGGLLLTWGDDYAKTYTIDFSIDGENWKEVYSTDNGNGKTDFVFFEPEEVRIIKINCLESGTGNGYSIAEFELKGDEEKATPIKMYKAAAKDSKLGLYPMWLKRLQEFWTVIGDENDEKESLFSEFGLVEPYKGMFTVMPYVIDNDELITWNDCDVSQSLEDNYLPIPSVQWKKDNWKLNIKAYTIGTEKTSNSVVRYQLHNTGNETFKGKLVLAIFPVNLNPTWQHGGLCAINNMEFKTEGKLTTVEINEHTGLISVETPDAMGGTPMENGNIVKFIQNLKVPNQTKVQDNEGLASGAMMYDVELKPGKKKDIVIVYPLWWESPVPNDYKSNPSSFFTNKLEDVKKKWNSLIDRVHIKIPEMRMINVMKSNIAYILINKDGPWIKPGSRNYSHSWVRDGAMTCVALLRMGLIDPVREWVNAVTPHIHKTGMVPYIFMEGGNPIGFNYDDHSGEGKEFDSQGEYVFAIRQYIDYTGDKSILRNLYPKAIKALEFQKELRYQRKTAEYKNNDEKKPYYGILPLSNSHEGYYPAMHSHWDNFWGLRGLKDGLYLAKLENSNSDIDWIKRELEDFKKDLYNSINLSIERNNINYIPGCVEKADCDPTSTSIAIMMAGEVQNLPEKERIAMYDRYYNEFVAGMEPDKARTFTPYEVRTAEAFIRMGQRERAFVMLRWFLKDSVRPHGFNHMAEVVHAKYRAPSYIGDMPHTWVGSGYIGAVRAIFVYEQDDKLFLGAGLDPAWFKEGVTVKDLPTIYGDINYSVSEEAGKVFMNIGKPKRNPKGGTIIPLPKEYAGKTVKVNGNKVSLDDNKIILKNLPAEIEIY